MRPSRWLRRMLILCGCGSAHSSISLAQKPDVGAPDDLNVENGYHDTGACHCVLFKKVGETSKERAAQRAQQEFDKGEAAFTAGKLKQAAFYLGAMAHYLGDLSQFCHVM